MVARDVDLLETYLDAFPELRNRVRQSPLRVLWRNRWREIRGVRKLFPGIELNCSGEVKVVLSPNSTVRYSRERVKGKLLALIQDYLGSIQKIRVLDKTDRTRHQSEAILRAHVRTGNESLMVLALYEDESSDLTGRLLTSLTLWWDRLSDVDSAAIFLPERWSERVLTLLPLLNVPVSCFKYLIETEVVRQIYPILVETSRLQSPYVIYPMKPQAPKLLLELREEYPSLDLLFRRGNWELSYLGLPVVWIDPDGTARYDFQQRHRIEDQASIRSHICRVMAHRSFPPSSASHLYFRFGEERWLESLVLRNHRKIDRDFAGQVYCQVPTWVGDDRRVLDLLTITRQGRLAVLELKTQKELSFLMQGLDYWERVEHHRLQGDFGPAGYFSGVEILDAPPLLYLVCPLFEFHEVLAVVRRYLGRHLAVRCVGINSDWKRNLEILRRFEL